jgi:pyruvate dehydrogenase E2 component (dihydrolipoamide acetyltransferase)
MATRVVMPSFGMYTAEGTFTRWLVEPGAAVEAGDLIAEITTEKASYEIEAPADGFLLQLAKAGDPLTVEGLIGWVLAEGEAVPETPQGGGRGQGPPGSAALGVAGLAPARGAEVNDAGRIKASPAARRLATERGVDLAMLTGTGPGGRIVEADVLAAAGSTPASAATTAKVAAVPWRVARRIPLTGVRGAVAARLRQSANSAIALTLTREVRCEALWDARAAWRERHGELPWDAVFVKVLADALRARPALNAIVHGDEILVLDEVHVGFAVPVDEGLLVPVVRDADRRPLAEVAATVRELGARARAGRIGAADLLGGTATVSNLGAHGVDAFTPVLNPPQAVVLGVGRMAERALVEEGKLVAGRTCVLSLTFDHRVADGAPAALLLDEIAQRIATPAAVARLLAEPARA